MKVYIVIKSEHYQHGYVIFGVFLSRQLALEEVEKIIAGYDKDDEWLHDTSEDAWDNVHLEHVIEIVEEEAIE